jgi:hypothetical protein
MALCLETLVCILDFGSGTLLQKRPSIIAHSESTSGMDSEIFQRNEEDEAKTNDFQLYISRLHRVEDFTYLINNFARLIKNPLDVC